MADSGTSLLSTSFWGQLPPTVHTISTDPFNSDQSTVDTIHQMTALTLGAVVAPSIQDLLKHILATSPGYDPHKDMSLVRVLYYWVKNHVTFVEDETIAKQQLGYTDDVLNTPEGAMDLLISPTVIIAMPQPVGDCDDYSMLLASLLIAAHMPVWFVAVAVDDMQPNRFSHVYLKTFVDGRFMYLDASHGQYPGWETRKQYRKTEWRIN